MYLRYTLDPTDVQRPIFNNFQRNDDLLYEQEAWQVQQPRDYTGTKMISTLISRRGDNWKPDDCVNFFCRDMIIVEFDYMLKYFVLLGHMGLRFCYSRLFPNDV